MCEKDENKKIKTAEETEFGMSLSPMMNQYLEIKKKHEDAILFFRLGDFYEMFFDDAKIASKELDLVLTGKLCGDSEKAPMCGVPFHSADVYVGKLIEKGYKVVICEQTEDPALAKGLVSRDVIRIVTPGTVTDANQLSEGKNNFIMSIYITGQTSSVCVADITTGEMRATVLPDCYQSLINELAAYLPREILINKKIEQGTELYECVKSRLNATVNDELENNFDTQIARNSIEEYLRNTPEALEIIPDAINAVGALVSYIAQTQMTDISYLKKPIIYTSGEYMEIDVNTRRNLELCETMRTKEKKGTLLWVLDKTKTSMGARLLRKWIDMPLKNANQICARQDVVEEFIGDFLLRENLAEQLKPVLDLERLMTKVIYGTANGKDLRAISNTISVLPEIKRLLSACRSKEIVRITAEFDTLEDINEVIIKTIDENAPFSIREGGFINDGVNEELDRLRSILHNSKQYLDDIETREKELTGIKNMKIGYNRVFGYYLEVSKSNVSQVPQTYIRKQTLTGGERYITPELKELEATILGASDKINALEYEIFRKVCELLSQNVRRIQSAAENIALVDTYLSLANVASKNGYVRPEVDIGSVLDIKEGRHPVVELFCNDQSFVPNDTLLDTDYNRLIILTGPNMAGKSTYMRQVALICVMAQIGSFVPAKEARIGVVDKLFTRVGASDDLASGQSTFMLEMTEVAYILKNATAGSLIIYDEIGRGTSTFDGMSIAKAVAEYTASKKIGARTLFATHYHELCELGDKVDGIVNYSITAKKRDKGIVFLRKIVRGAADDSYGIEVAQLAGVPRDVVKRAKEVLAALEEENAKPRELKKANPKEPDTISIDDYINNEIAEKLRMADVETLTPIEALNFLYELKKIL